MFSYLKKESHDAINCTYVCIHKYVSIFYLPEKREFDVTNKRKNCGRRAIICSFREFPWNAKSRDMRHFCAASPSFGLALGGLSQCE